MRQFSLLFSVSAALLCTDGQAQALPGGAQLGMTVPQLQQAVPGLQPVVRPARLAGGLVGSWSGPEVDIAGVLVVPTFYFADRQLRRVEYLAGTGGFDRLLAWGRASYGPELASQAPEGAYASWSTSGADAYLQQVSVPRAQVRLVVKQHLEKDAGEL